MKFSRQVKQVGFRQANERRCPHEPAEQHQSRGIDPSQLLYTYGIGAIVDLPHLSAIVSGFG